ncbi:MAG: type II toxin-antitoxin system RelE/ParE family toxin [Planctomycetes bacterium]|nr:type II toxin-antitoxin system RelE/ParE family toxin [Planctomycetota bacterium]MCW5641720.1 type II toxin-antitoxin system RelE/ParE family toxin [Rhodoferax sp.]
MTYSLHPEATKELEEALAFYREQGGVGLARAFLAEFERVATLLASNHGFGTLTSGRRRSFPLRRFPYSLIYSSTGQDIRILVVGHQHRRPGYWSGRK